MGIFINDKDTFEAVVNYVFDKAGEIHIIDKEDEENICKSKEEKEKIVDRLTHETEIPFNVAVDIVDYEKKDIRSATFNFRQPSFEDMPFLLSSFASIDKSGNIRPGDFFEFNNRKIKTLFVNGIAQDESGKTVTINANNLGKISPVLGSAMAAKMNDLVKI
jgi:hypothetical protein